jgi:hypothetical protein
MIGASRGSTPNSSANSALPGAGGYASRACAKKKKPVEGDAQSKLMTWIRRPSMLALTPDDKEQIPA